MVICKICNFECDNNQLLSSHIKNKHNIKSEEYYLKYISTKSVCLVCGNDTKFKGLSKGYADYCSNICSNNSKIKQNKIRSVCLEKYGVPVSSMCESVKTKAKQTNLEKYGYISPSLNVDVRNKINETNIKLYGGHPMNNSNISKKLKVSNRTKYWSQFLLSLKYKNIEPLFTFNEYLECKSEYKFRCNDCNTDFVYVEKHNRQMYSQTVCCDCKNNRSYIEQSVSTELSLFYNKLIETNKWFYKDNQKFELDIYIPEFNLGIEFNGLFWHSELYKDKNYHINKTKWFKNNFNIDIIHIREDEWINKKDIVLSIIKNKLKVNRKIFARNCYKLNISSNEYKKFLEENHIQGSINSKIKVGLFYKNELVSVIGIGKSRFKKDELELHRMCHKKGYSIIGGFSKLMKDFNNIITYCDRRYFDGSGYKSIGFELLSETNPSFVYTKGNSIISRNSVWNDSIHKYIKTYDKNITKDQNMFNNSWFKIYDCGCFKMIYKKG